MSSNKTLKNAQPRSPRPASRNRVRELALRGIPLQSISSNGNRQQSRNIHLLTNVREIKDHCKTLQSQLRRMQRESELQCEELYEKLKKTDGKEIDDLKGLLKKCNDENEENDKIIKKYQEYYTKIKQKLNKCNDEKEEKDKIIKKLNKELESCNREKEEKDQIISHNQSLLVRYQTFYKKFKE
jgi:chromosome segregation ATPase